MSEWDQFAPAEDNPWDQFAPAEQPKPQSPDRWGNAAEGVVNDIGAAFQGVNPIAASESRGQAVGVLRPEWPGSKNMIVDVDGVREPLDKYPADRFITRQEGGTTYVYPRTEDMAASRAESAGRALGYGVISNMGAVAKTAQAPAAPLVKPTLGMRGPASSTLSATMEKSAVTAGPVAADKARFASEFGQAAEDTISQVGSGARNVDAGAALKSGGKEFIKNVNTREGVLWGRVDNMIGADMPIKAPETEAFIAKTLAPTSGTPNIQSATGTTKMAGWLEDIQSGKLTWQGARDLRTAIREALDNPAAQGPLAGYGAGRLKQISAALTKDLDAAAEGVGGATLDAYRRANQYTKASSARIESAFEKILKADTDEKAYGIMEGWAQNNTARGNVASLQKLFRSLPKDEAATVASAYLRRMGRPLKGAASAEENFDVARFLTNWNDTSPEAKRIFASAGVGRDVTERLTRLAEIASDAKKSGAMSSPSGAAIGNVGTAIVGAGVGTTLGLPAALALGAAAHMSARALSNPNFLDAVIAFSKGQTNKLRLIAKGDSPLAIEAATILRLQAGQTSQPLALPAP